MRTYETDTHRRSKTHGIVSVKSENLENQNSEKAAPFYPVNDAGGSEVERQTLAKRFSEA